jgi:hypothetical protein
MANNPQKQPSGSLVKNTSDPKDVHAAAKREKMKRWQELEDLRGVLASEPGRRVLWRFMTHYGVLRSVWSPSAAIHRDSGMQDAGLHMLEEIKAARSAAFIEMWHEANKREEEELAILEAQRKQRDEETENDD